MLIVKMMAPDRTGKDPQTSSDDPRAIFSLHADIRTVVFERPADAERPIVTLTDEHYISVPYGVFGPVYVLNEAGKTIEQFHP